ncbi:methylmalonyl-CoA epimerase [Microlunatus speluncae]|uniref:methylmalonyl-CoA epimerase n=1 Tax=Microlunatus speluncae TaxID=2594267 RepID=UPI00126661ED|nr:methylmalonyl-CoA epimerase [Microlunatus speluncae]
MSGNSLPRGPIADLLLAVDHVGIAVPDLEAGIAFYRDTLGLELRHREDNTEQRVTEVMLAPAGRPDSTQLQLLAPLGDDSPIAKFLDRAGPGLQHLALRVTDARTAGDRLRTAGLRLLYDLPRRGTADSLINFVHPRDTGGVLIELVQPVGQN